MNKHSLFTERYRPQTIEEAILPKKVVSALDPIVNGDGKFPNMLFSGAAGTGKTTAAFALARHLGIHDPLIINGSLNRGIDMVRHDIPNYASGMSMYGNRKMVIIDEADYLTEEAQVAMRNLMETMSKHCGFIMTANYPNRIIDALHSRCTHIFFAYEKGERKAAMKNQFLRIKQILKEEGVEYDSKKLGSQVSTVILQHFPDFRKVLNIVQTSCVNGKVDPSILIENSEKDTIDRLLETIASKNFTASRKWLGENVSAVNSDRVFTALYDAVNSGEFVSNDTLPNALVLIGQYQMYASQVVNQEINFAALIAELLAACNFK